MSYKLPPVTHGVFMSTVTQSYTGLTSGQTIYFNTSVDADSGIILSGTTKFVVSSSGDYRFDVSAICSQTSGTNISYDQWFRKNGINIANSNTRLIINNAATDQILATPFIIDMSSNDYVELLWWASASQAQFVAYSALTNPTRPDVPSIIVAVSKISE